MTTIPVTDGEYSEGLILQVLPNGHMECYLDEQALNPVPLAVRDWALLHVGREELSPKASPAQAKSVGLQKLIEVAPVHINVPYSVLRGLGVN